MSLFASHNLGEKILARTPGCVFFKMIFPFNLGLYVNDYRNMFLALSVKLKIFIHFLDLSNSKLVISEV